MKRRNRLSIVVLFAASALRAQEQPQHSAFGCSNHAVQLDIERQPQLKFIPLPGIPQEAISYNPQHTFQVQYAGPFRFVTFHLAATIGEQLAGRGIPAKLGVYVETKQDGFSQTPAQFWQLVSTAAPTSGRDRTSERLAFDSNRVTECLKSEDAACEFAAIKLATTDPNLPLLDLSFLEDLGGANASNSQEAHLLLDFRSSPPRVLVTADCAYNEGGGVCTAIDSGMAPRSDLQCDWAGDQRDFLCSEVRDPEGSAHRDYYLLRDVLAPLRNGEVATLEEAVKSLRARESSTIKMRGVGVVAWIGEVNRSAREKVIVLGSLVLDGGAQFYFIPESPLGLGTPVTISPHEFGEKGNPASVAVDARDWTMDQIVSFTTRQVYEDRSLTVLQVVAKSVGNRLYWIGVGKDSALPAIDVVELAGGSKYANCGHYQVPASVVAVRNIARPFRAVLHVQPPTVTSDGDAQPISWSNGTDGEPGQDCQRAAELRWTRGRFQSTMQAGKCAQPEKPRYVLVDDAGKVKLSDQTAP